MMGGWAQWSLRSLPTQAVLWFVQVQQFRDTAARLQTAYAGEKAAGIQEQEQEVSRALQELLEACSGRRARLVDTADKHRFFSMARDLLSWMESTVRQIKTQEKPRYGCTQWAPGMGRGTDGTTDPGASVSSGTSPRWSC